MRRTEAVEPQQSGFEKWSSILGSVWPLATALVTGAGFIFVLSSRVDHAEAQGRELSASIEKIQDDRAAKFAQLSSEISALKADTQSIKESLNRIDRKLDK